MLINDFFLGQLVLPVVASLRFMLAAAYPSSIPLGSAFGVVRWCVKCAYRRVYSPIRLGISSGSIALEITTRANANSCSQRDNFIVIFGCNPIPRYGRCQQLQPILRVWRVLVSTPKASRLDAVQEPRQPTLTRPSSKPPGTDVTRRFEQSLHFSDHRGADPGPQRAVHRQSLDSCS